MLISVCLYLMTLVKAVASKMDEEDLNVPFIHRSFLRRDKDIRTGSNSSLTNEISY